MGFSEQTKPVWLSPYGLNHLIGLIPLLTLGFEALTAVHGPVSAGLEGNLRGTAAAVADHFEHLPGAVSAVLGTTGSAAGGAAAGLILEALLGEESLLAGGEDEFVAAVTAGQCFVLIHSGNPPYNNDC